MSACFSQVSRHQHPVRRAIRKKEDPTPEHLPDRGCIIGALVNAVPDQDTVAQPQSEYVLG
jgi:hypothetical protein